MAQSTRSSVSIVASASESFDLHLPAKFGDGHASEEKKEKPKRRVPSSGRGGLGNIRAKNKSKSKSTGNSIRSASSPSLSPSSSLSLSPASFRFRGTFGSVSGLSAASGFASLLTPGSGSGKVIRNESIRSHSTTSSSSTGTGSVYSQNSQSSIANIIADEDGDEDGYCDSHCDCECDRCSICAASLIVYPSASLSRVTSLDALQEDVEVEETFDADSNPKINPSGVSNTEHQSINHYHLRRLSSPPSTRAAVPRSGLGLIRAASASASTSSFTSTAPSLPPKDQAPPNLHGNFTRTTSKTKKAKKSETSVVQDYAEHLRVDARQRAVLASTSASGLGSVDQESETRRTKSKSKTKSRFGSQGSGEEGANGVGGGESASGTTTVVRVRTGRGGAGVYKKVDVRVDPALYPKAADISQQYALRDAMQESALVAAASRARAKGGSTGRGGAGNRNVTGSAIGPAKKRVELRDEEEEREETLNEVDDEDEVVTSGMEDKARGKEGTKKIKKKKGLRKLWKRVTGSRPGSAGLDSASTSMPGPLRSDELPEKTATMEKEEREREVLAIGRPSFESSLSSPAGSGSPSGALPGFQNHLRSVSDPQLQLQARPQSSAPFDHFNGKLHSSTHSHTHTHTHTHPHHRPCPHSNSHVHSHTHSHSHPNLRSKAEASGIGSVAHPKSGIQHASRGVEQEDAVEPVRFVKSVLPDVPRNVLGMPGTPGFPMPVGAGAGAPHRFPAATHGSEHTGRSGLARHEQQQQQQQSESVQEREGEVVEKEGEEVDEEEEEDSDIDPQVHPTAFKLQHPHPHQYQHLRPQARYHDGYQEPQQEEREAVEEGDDDGAYYHRFRYDQRRERRGSFPCSPTDTYTIYDEDSDPEAGANANSPESYPHLDPEHESERELESYLSHVNSSSSSRRQRPDSLDVAIRGALDRLDSGRDLRDLDVDLDVELERDLDVRVDGARQYERTFQRNTGHARGGSGASQKAFGLEPCEEESEYEEGEVDSDPFDLKHASTLLSPLPPFQSQAQTDTQSPASTLSPESPVQDQDSHIHYHFPHPPLPSLSSGDSAPLRRAHVPRAPRYLRASAPLIHARVDGNGKGRGEGGNVNRKVEASGRERDDAPRPDAFDSPARFMSSPLTRTRPLTPARRPPPAMPVPSVPE